MRPQSCGDAEHNAEHKADEKAAKCELERRPYSCGDHLADRLLRGVAVAEIADGHLLEEGQVLDNDRPIEAETPAFIVEYLVADRRAAKRQHDRVAGNELQHGE